MRTRNVGLATLSLLTLSWTVAYAQDTGRERYAEARIPQAQTFEQERPTAPPRPTLNPRLSGHFTLATPGAAVQRRVEQGIAQAVARMSFVTRSFGARRLRETNTIRRHIRTEVVGNRVTVALGRFRYTTPNGQWRNVREPTGQAVRLRQTAFDDRIEQLFRSPDGTKLTVYRFSRNGENMRLEVTVRSPRLPDPLRYSIPYRRVQRPAVAVR